MSLIRVLEGMSVEEIAEALEARLTEGERYELGKLLVAQTIQGQEDRQKVLERMKAIQGVFDTLLFDD